MFEGELDAGAAKDLILFEMAKKNPRIKEELRVLARSPPVPNSARRSFRCFSLISMMMNWITVATVRMVWAMEIMNAIRTI